MDPGHVHCGSGSTVARGNTSAILADSGIGLYRSGNIGADGLCRAAAANLTPLAEGSGDLGSHRPRPCCPPILQGTVQNYRGCPSKSRADPAPTISILSASRKSPAHFSETGFSLKHESRTSSAMAASTATRTRSQGTIGTLIRSSDHTANWLPLRDDYRNFFGSDECRELALAI